MANSGSSKSSDTLESAQSFREKYKTAANTALSYTVALALVSSTDIYELVGSGVLVSGGGKVYVATATHVLNELNRSSSTPVAVVNKGVIPLNLQKSSIRANSTVEYDICVIEIEQTIQSILSHNFYIGDKILRSPQIITGFPIKRNSTSDIGAASAIGHLKWGYFAAIIALNQTIKPYDQRLTTDDHWFFRYDGGVYSPAENQEFLNASANNIPSLRGLSGCGVWVALDESRVALAGIFIELSDQIGVATKIKHLKTLI